MARQFDARHLSATSNTQIQMQNWYDISIPDHGDLSLMVNECSLPDISLSVVELSYGNSISKVPGQLSYGSGNFTFRDAIKMDIERDLLKWMNDIIKFDTGAMGWIDEFKRDMYVTQYGPDGTEERVWQFAGAWPSNINGGSMSHSGADAKIISVTMEYDRAFRTDI